jgi:thermitase
VALASTDPGFQLQWGMVRIGAPAAWDQSRGSGVKVAVVDTGADLDHPDLAGRLDTTSDYDFVNGDPTAEDDHGHGTHVAGIIGATLNNGAGVAGVANRCTVLPLKALDSDGSGYDSDVADAIRWAADHGASVVSLSLGGGYSSAIEAAVQYAAGSDCVVVAAAGNSSGYGVSYPAACPNVIGVGSTDSSDSRSSFSSYGPGVDIAAPGSWIYSTIVGGYGYMSGTSMSTPLVAGVMALVRAQNPAWSRTVVEQRVLSTSVDLGPKGRDDYFGYGRVDARSAVTMPGSVSGQVTCGGIGLAGAAVSVARGGSAATSADGRYSISGLAAGSYTVTFSKSGYVSQKTTVTIASGRTTSADAVLRRVSVPPRHTPRTHGAATLLQSVARSGSPRR